ncbi:hypothetical protein C6P46_002298 [Rhodotorula mucilaginosa]|uniref:RNase III domain-containing protein n=1 Tax=Rhodotorula mucilaginosa TaxID=5537 RepID=A0A9P6W4I7_RHOMI|nr:hypothetical protein C6P46_002298 [Rhodotorula mucilaginosa]
MPVARTASAAASALRAFARAARPQPAPAACCNAPAASTSRALATSAVARSPDSPTSSPSPSSSSSAAAEPNPSPAFASRYPPGAGTHLYAPSAAAQRAYLESLLGVVGIPNPQLVDEQTAEKTLTHKSGVDKTALYSRKLKRSELHAVQQEQAQQRSGGHNEKFAFVGRRLLRLHLTQHLFSRLSSSNPALLSTVLTAPSQMPLSIESILDTKTLGASVGKAWRLEEALRWREVRGQDGEMTGLWKCRGAGVEGVIGMVFTTQGIDATHRVFEQLVLPHLALPITLERALAAATTSSNSPSPASVSA